jgi:hypothetical protein
MAEKW